MKKDVCYSLHLKLSLYRNGNVKLNISYKGYICRRYNHDYFARKQFLGHVVTNAIEVKEQIENQGKLNEIECQKAKEEMARAEFAMITGNLHHLMSTKIQPGVYNSPYIAVKPQVFNVDIETHLQTSFKSNYQWKPPSANRISFFKELAKEEFIVRNKIKYVNKGINEGTHDSMAATVKKFKTKQIINPN